MGRGVWIFFDLGIQGDYDGIYAWLDNHRAHECGENLAFIRYDFQSDLLEELRKDMASHIELTPKNRVYVVFQDESGNAMGRFLFGRRMRAPWTGYGSLDQEDAMDEA